MKYLMCNLKSNMTLEEIISYEHSLRKFSKKDINLVLFPSHPYLVFFRDEIYNLGSQDVSCFKGGAYTGEVNAMQLKSMNVKYCFWRGNLTVCTTAPCIGDFFVKGDG